MAYYRPSAITVGEATSFLLNGGNHGSHTSCNADAAEDSHRALSQPYPRATSDVLRIDMLRAPALLLRPPPHRRRPVEGTAVRHRKAQALPSESPRPWRRVWPAPD